MKNLFVTILLVIIVMVLGLKFCCYQVRETESVLVTRFGKPVAERTEPKLYVKWPAPIEQIHRFDSRLQLFEGQMEETTTKGGEPVIVTSYIAWRIAEPRKFFERVSTVSDVQKFLMSQLRNEQNDIIGRHYFSEFINTDPKKIHFGAIETELRDALGKELSEQYGIEVDMVGIKKFEINEDVTKEVFNRMKADRNRKTETILGVGNATATKIRTDAESKKKELLAAANARAKAIMGRGDAEAAKYYKMLEADPELAMFLRDIEALKIMLKKDTTIVLGADTQPIKLLKEIPDISPKSADGTAEGAAK